MMSKRESIYIFIAAVILTFVLIVEGQCIHGDVRLERGSGPWEGHVMVCSHGTWGSVCGSGWDLNDAIVTCRQLGYDSELGVDYYSDSYFGYRPLDTPTVLSGVDCVGDEQSLNECKATESLGNTDVKYCDPGHMAGVFCGYGKTCTNGDLRFTSTKCFDRSCKSGRSEGRLEYCKEGSWTYICDYPQYKWSVNEVQVACRQLGFVSNKLGIGYSYGGGFLSTLDASNIHCNTGSEESLTQCLVQESSYCPSQYHSAGAICYTYGSNGDPCSEGDVRLFSAFSDTPSNEGILQTCNEDSVWYSVCFDSSPSTEYLAKTACVQLGYKGTLAVRHNGGFFYGFTEHNDPVVHTCNATTTDLSQCQHSEHNYSYCGSRYSAMGLVCYTGGNECADGSVRLVDTDTGLDGVDEGRVEYCYDSLWSPVCSLSVAEGEMMCQKMGYSRLGEFSVLASDKRSNKKSSFNYIDCNHTTSTSDLSDCIEVTKDTTTLFMADTTCDQEYMLKCLNTTEPIYEAFGSNCTNNDMKLINPSSPDRNNPSYGILVVCIHGNYTTLSTEGWDESYTAAACRDVLDYDYEVIDATMYPDNSTIPGLQSPYLHYISCTGNIKKLSECNIMLTHQSLSDAVVRLCCIPVAHSSGSPIYIFLLTVISTGTTIIAIIVLIVVLVVRQSARAVRHKRNTCKEQQMENSLGNHDRVSIASMYGGNNDEIHLLQEENLW